MIPEAFAFVLGVAPIAWLAGSLVRMAASAGGAEAVDPSGR